MPLTEQQHQQIDQLVAAGELDEDKFLSRLAAGDTFPQAINNTLGGRLSSNVRRIFLEAATPGLTVQETADFFKQHGVLGGAFEIAKGTFTAPFSAIAELASGEVPERPIETATNLASAIPLARIAAGPAAAVTAMRLPRAAKAIRGFQRIATPISQVQEFAEQVTQPREELLELGGNIVTEGLGLASGAFAQNVETGAGAPARAPSVELEPVVEDGQGNFVPEINLLPQQPSPTPEAEIDTAPTELEPIPTSETFAKGSRVRVINAEGQLGDNTFVVQRLDGDTAHITVEGSTTGTSMPVPVSQLFPGDAVVELTAADLEAEPDPTGPPRPQEPFVPPDVNLLPSSVEATQLPPEPQPPQLTPEIEPIPEAEAIRTEETGRAAELEAIPPEEVGDVLSQAPPSAEEARAEAERFIARMENASESEIQGAPIRALEARNLIQRMAPPPAQPNLRAPVFENEMTPRELKIAEDLATAGILERRTVQGTTRFELDPEFQDRAGIATEILDSLGENTPIDPDQLAGFLTSEIGRIEAERITQINAAEEVIAAGAEPESNAYQRVGTTIVENGPKDFNVTIGDRTQTFTTAKRAFDFAQDEALKALGIKKTKLKRFGLSRDQAAFLVSETQRRLPLMFSNSNLDAPRRTTIAIPGATTFADLSPTSLSTIHRRLTGLPLIIGDFILPGETYTAALARMTNGTTLSPGDVAIEGDSVTIGDETWLVTRRLKGDLEQPGTLEVRRTVGGAEETSGFRPLDLSREVATLTKGPGHDIERLRATKLGVSSPLYTNNVEPAEDLTRPMRPGTAGRQLIVPEDLDYEVRGNEATSKQSGADAIESANNAANNVSSTRRGLDRPEGLPIISEEGVRTIGHAFTPELIETGQIDLTGQTIRGAADIAELAQIYRDPRFETLRIFYIKNGVVVGHEGVSSRMPAFTTALIRGESEAEFDAHTLKRMGDLDADGYYLQHNHPSTDTTPSAEDIEATERIQRSVPGFLSHVIIDHDTYTVLREEKKQIVSEVVRRDAGADALMQASVPHKYLNAIVARPDDIVNIGKAMATEDGYVTLLFLDTKSLVRAIQEVPIPFFTNKEAFTGYLRQTGREVGSPQAVSYYNGSDIDVGNVSVEYVEDGTLFDAVHDNRAITESIGVRERGERNFFGGVSDIDLVNNRVFSEAFAEYEPTPLMSEAPAETEVTVVGRGPIAGRFRNLLANPVQTMRFRLGHHPAGQWFKQLVAEMSAGQTTLRRTGAPGETLLNLAFDHLEDIPRRASGPERVAVKGLLKHTDRMVRKWRKDRGMSKGIAYAEIHRQIWDHLEGDAPVDTELTGLAGAWRTWRARQVDFHQRVMIEQSQLHEARFGVPIMIHSPDGSMRPWSPIEGEVGLYMPHYHKNTDVVFRRMIQDAEATNDVDLKARIKNYQKWLENGEAIRQHHLETERFFDLPGYTKDLSILNGDSFSFWRRVGELSAFGQNNQHLTVMSNAVANHSATDLEVAVKAFSDVVVGIARGMKLNIEGESRFEGGQNRVDDLVAIANAQERPVASELFNDMTTQQLDRLEREGLFRRATRADGNPGLQLTDRGAETIMRDFARRQMRRFQANQVISQLQHWKDVDPFEREARNVWGKMGDFATITMISVFTSLQNVFESTLLLTKTGAIPFAKATFSLATDPEMIRMADAIGATFEDATAFMVENQIHHPSKFLKAYGFTVTEKFTRVLGASAGWHAAIDLIDKDLSRGRPRTKPGRRNRSQRFAELRIDMRRIREAMDAEGATVEDFRASLGDIKRGVLEGATAVQGIRQPTRRDLPDWTNVLADEISKSALFVSQEVFKRYNRLDLPGFLVSKHPIIRVLGKFKGWYAQQHRYMRATFIQAIREARHLNFGPMIRLIEGMAAMGLGGMAYNAIMSQLTGRKEDEDQALFESVIKGIAGIGGFGYYGTLADLYRREGGNQFRIRSRLESMLLGPVFGRGAGIASQTIEAVTTGDVEGLAREAGRLVPSGLGRTIVPRIPRGDDRGVSPGERARRRADQR